MLDKGTLTSIRHWKVTYACGERKPHIGAGCCCLAEVKIFCVDKCVEFKCAELREHWIFLRALEAVVYAYFVCERRCVPSCTELLSWRLCFFFYYQSCSLWVERRGFIHVFDHGIVTGMVDDLCILRRVHIKLSRCCFERFMLVAFRCGMKSMSDFGTLSCMKHW